MFEAVDGRPDPERARYFRSCFEWSELWEVADAVAAATDTETLLYVERRVDQYRWSLVAYSSYPLLRIAARLHPLTRGPLRTQGATFGCQDLPDGRLIR